MGERVKEVARLFFRLGLTAFGGPAAHIAMMEDEVVHKRKWMSREHFLDLVGATNLIPGPNSTEMAIHCGFHRAGWLGLVTAGVCFICPAVVITGILAFIYVTYGTVPQVEPFFYGIRPAVLAIILGAVLKLGKKAVKNTTLQFIGLAVGLASLLGVNEITAILCGGVVGMFLLTLLPGKSQLSALAVPLGWKNNLWWAATLPVSAAASSISLSSIFFVFLKIGFVLFGSGYVLIAYLEGELIQKLQWLTQQELLDAVAIGQFTPGPVLSTSTFIGYQLNGWTGAVMATIGIFLPSFILVALLNPLIPKMRQSPWMSRFLDAVNVSAVGIMAAVTVDMAFDSLTDGPSLVIALAAVAAVTLFKNLNSAWLVLGGALSGYLLRLVF